MNLNIDYDVKEYQPKKRKKKQVVHDRENGMNDGAIQIDPGTVLTTSEILDFSEGVDSRP